MQDQTVPQTPASELLADPAQVAIVRELIQHGRKVDATHLTYGVKNLGGRLYGPIEHVWKAGHCKVVLCRQELLYQTHGVTILHVRNLTGPRQVAQLLAAIGVLPERFITAAAPAVEPTNPDRRCRRCGATSGLRLVVVNPLSVTYREWECVNGCKDGAR